MQRILYLMQKEFRQIFREKFNLIIIFIIPFIQLVVLGFAITTDVTNISTTIVDQDRSVLSRRIIDSFSVTKTFKYQGLASSTEQAIHQMDIGKTRMILVIPEYFERDLKLRAIPKIQVILDGVDGNGAGIANGYASIIFSKLQREWTQLTKLPAKQFSLHMVNIQTRMLYNPKLESPNNIVPGIIALLLTMVTLFLTTINVVREKEIGTLEQLAVTPLQNHELIIGKILPFGIMGFLLFNVGLLAAGLIFGIWIKGSLLLLYLFTLIYMMTVLGLGIFISVAASTQQQAMFMAWFFSIFAIILSGFFIPIENMPPFIQAITLLNPTRYFMEVVRGIILKASDLRALWSEMLALLIFGGVILSSAILSFHKRLK